MGLGAPDFDGGEPFLPPEMGDVEMRHGRHRPRPAHLPVPDVSAMEIPALEFYEEHGGHTLRRHVGTSPQQDAERLQREPDIGAAGSFYTRDIAQAAMEATIRDHAREIERWLREGGEGTFVAETFFQQRVGGVLSRAAYRRGITEPAPATGARIVLRRDDSLPGGFLVRTCYTVIAPDRAAPHFRDVAGPEERRELLGRHLVTREDLAGQLDVDRSLSRALRFTDEEMAARAVDSALESWGSDIRRWVLNGGGEEYRAVHRCAEPVAEALHRDLHESGQPPEPIQKIRFVLVANPSSEAGFQVSLVEPYVSPQGEDETR